MTASNHDLPGQAPPSSETLVSDLRALALLLSVHTPKQLHSALIPTLQELLSKCRACQQQRNSLQEQEAKERKTKDDEGATPVKRRRVSSDEEHAVDSCGEIKAEPREALTPTSTSDNETRDSSIIDPGTEQDPPSPENGSVREYRMEAPPSFSEDVTLGARSQRAEEQPGGGRCEERKEFKELQTRKDSPGPEEDPEFPSTSISAVLSDLAELRSCDGRASPAQDPESALAMGCGHSRGLFSHVQQHDVLDILCRTIESTIHLVTRISAKGNQAAS
ncbi:ubiquitin carboxyl-terminal hydrolase 34-like [Colius striatus]|uniref:ubiquitin carboxyl-terminal hydrolase 34-like n=1 Tax=Colius striatus TaxID=57412 RepID=UPI002B1E247E|nr:ubiquitin carboxyl-terminal hydrolase 34-like [Colius striatus]